MATQKIETGLIADSAVTTAKLADNSVTGAKIAAASLSDQVKGISSSADAVAITIDSSENVGIGTDSPTGDGTALHIHGSTHSTLHLTNSTTGSTVSDGFDIVTDGSDTLLRNRETGAIKFRIGSSEAMRIDSSGNLGIGHNSPSSFSSGANNLVVNDTAGAGGITIVTPNDAKGSIFFADSTSATGQGRIRYNHNGDYMTFGTSGSEDKLVIDSSGNLGLGTNSPNSYSGQTALTINSTGVARLDLDISNTRQGYILAESGYVGIFADSGKTLRLGAGGDEDIRILASGYVGIGTQSPATALEVNNLSAGDTVATFEGDYGAGGDVQLVRYERSGGAVYGAISYKDATTDMEFGNISSHNLSFTTGNTRRMTIDTSGNVGIGISPSNTFSVGASGTVTTRYTSTDTSAFSLLQFENSGSIVLSADHGNSAANSNIIFKSDGATEHMRIDSAGTLFLGTTTPTLHSAVTGIVLENGSLLTDTPRAASRSITLAQNAAVDSGNTYAYLATDEASAYQQFNGNHYFYTAPSGSAGADITFSTKLQVSNAGLVTTPSQPFFMTNRAAGNQTFANAAWVDLSWTGEPYDTGNNYTLSSGVFTAPVAGVYLFTGLIGFDTIAATNYVLARMVCSTAGDFYTTHEQKRSGGGDYGYDHAISQMVYLAASETVKMQVYAGGGGNHTIGNRSNWQGRLLG